MQTCFGSIRRRLASPDEEVLGVGYGRWCDFSLTLIEYTCFNKKISVTKKRRDDEWLPVAEVCHFPLSFGLVVQPTGT